MTRLRSSSRAAVALVTVALLFTGLVASGAARSAPDRTLVLSAPSEVVSDVPFDIRVDVSGPLAELGFTGSPAESGAITELLALRDGQWLSVASRLVEGPEVVYQARVWKSDQLRVRLTWQGALLESETLEVMAVPSGRRVSSQLPEPRDPFPAAPQALGDGGNPSIRAIPDELWDRMRGVSWQPGCPVGRADLNMIEVNYWGFDGYRYRGRIVVAERIASRVARIFSELHEMRYPIRQMRLPEVFGRDKTRGASDYASMGADNTSGFNCRYVVGRERQRVLSPHAYGTAVDVNPWENPYKSPIGVLPEPAWVRGPSGHPAALRSPNDPVVRAFTSRGAEWGGTWKSHDWQHFEW